MPDLLRPSGHAVAGFSETLPQPREAQQGALPMCHWRPIAAAFADTGGLVTGDELADMIRVQCMRDTQPIVSQPVSLVARWIVAQRVLTINGPWGRLLPMFQFDLPRAAVHPGMRPLLAELKGALSEVELALWFVTPNEWLDGAQPAVAMQTMLPAVRDAARADRFVALGG